MPSMIESLASGDLATRVVQRDGWVTFLCKIQALKVNLDIIRSRLRELEGESDRMKQDVKE